MDINTEFAVVMTAVVTLIAVLFVAVPIVWRHDEKRRYAEDKWNKMCHQDMQHCQEIERLKRELEQLRIDAAQPTAEATNRDER